MSNDLTVHESYLAMYAYLERYYQLTGADEVGAMLGGMSLLDDGGTADPAVWSDWLDAVESVNRDRVDARLQLDTETTEGSEESD